MSHKVITSTPSVIISPTSRFHAVTASLFCAVCLSGCGLLASPSNPDVVYSSSAESAKSLQVPPDLTDVSEAEQFVLPGTSSAAVTRNTLLPQFNTIRFVREGEQSWLEFQSAPESLWPQLLSFLRSEKFPISQTVPAAGVIQTQWRSANQATNSSIFRNLVSDDNQFSRIGFRLERVGVGARLFARSQVASSEADQLPDSVSWPASSHDPENTSELLNRFLVFLGVEQQRVRGILGDDQARAVLDDAVIQTNAAGSEILINKGFNTAFSDVLVAMDTLNYRVIRSDARVGRIEFLQAQNPLVMQMSPLHVSAVKASVTNSDGARLDDVQEQELLKAMAEQLV